MDKKVAVITGISRGIGKAIGERFEDESVTVVGFSRSKPQGKCSLWVNGDVTSIEDRQRLLTSVLQKYGRVDILVNNAGLGMYNTWQDTAMEDLHRIFDINFFSLVEMTKLFVPELVKTRGTIINVSSVAGKMAVPCMGGYCATKYAVNAFSDSLRIELKPKGIHVLNLIVGRINTGFSRNSLGGRKPPQTPGAGHADLLAKKAYKAYVQGKREITYPSWYRVFMKIIKMLPGLYEKANIKKWGLD